MTAYLMCYQDGRNTEAFKAILVSAIRIIVNGKGWMSWSKEADALLFPDVSLRYPCYLDLL